MIAVINSLIFFVLFFLPLVIFPLKLSPYEKPKVIIFELAVQLLIVILLITKKVIFKKVSLSLLFILALIGLISIYHLLFSHSTLTLFGNPIRFQGTFLLWHLMAFSAISSFVMVRKIPALVPIASALLLLAGALYLNTNINGRAVGTLGEPNALAAVAIFIWPFIFFAEKLKKQISIFAKLAGVVFTLEIIYISQSKSALVALLVQIIFLLLIKFVRLPMGKALTIALILMLSSLILPFLDKSKIFENRLEVWQVSLKTAWQKPMLGWGFGNVEYALEKTAKSFNYNFVRYQYVDSAHNLWLDWWIQGGFVGFAAIAYLVLKSLFNLAEKNNLREIMAFLGIITAMSFNPTSIVTLAAFWWLIGQGFSQKK
ncbi:hypothetical protein A3I53_01070 [Candidatus Curtissbacteria bacterium RIFCSPLOWO2_02_FULL_40_13b]|uniref:O-antigen ligase-related domain-containing protein n=1 Tax=Candidatus Curtissbacteria bacterium RIFCSPLOWO2_02_FULL_40_13b TaxID=1797733 RepID=A0A1F5HY99_9BACT|nr:MAG: hypothetical protein A3I53_01070 [Candidatus Curtissbacteria bacterium RIFCSPLOWO2_02_FULL_40_13b]